jgi:hypothetical protein
VADVKGPAQESWHARRRVRGRSVGKGRLPSEAKHPSHQVFVGRAEIGAAWSKESNEAGPPSLKFGASKPNRHLRELFDDEDSNPSPSQVVRPQADRRLRRASTGAAQLMATQTMRCARIGCGQHRTCSGYGETCEVRNHKTQSLSSGLRATVTVQRSCAIARNSRGR